MRATAAGQRARGAAVGARCSSWLRPRRSLAAGCCLLSAVCCRRVANIYFTLVAALSLTPYSPVRWAAGAADLQWQQQGLPQQQPHWSRCSNSSEQQQLQQLQRQQRQQACGRSSAAVQPADAAASARARAWCDLLARRSEAAGPLPRLAVLQQQQHPGNRLTPAVAACLCRPSPRRLLPRDAGRGPRSCRW